MYEGHVSSLLCLEQDTGCVSFLLSHLPSVLISDLLSHTNTHTHTHTHTHTPLCHTNTHTRLWRGTSDIWKGHTSSLSPVL